MQSPVIDCERKATLPPVTCAEPAHLPVRILHTYLCESRTPGPLFLYVFLIYLLIEFDRYSPPFHQSPRILRSTWLINASTISHPTEKTVF